MKYTGKGLTIGQIGAFKAWYEEDMLITKAAREAQITPEEVMLAFKRLKPLSFRIFMVRMEMLIGAATILAAVRTMLRDFRDMVERSLGA